MSFSTAVFDQDISFDPGTTVAAEFYPVRYIVQPRHSEWRGSVEKQLNEMCRLPRNWNGYRSSPVAFVNAKFAMEVIETVAGRRPEAPQIVPGINGDLQIEWHFGEDEIELHILAPNKINAWCSFCGEDGEDIELTNDLKKVVEWLDTAEDNDAAE